ncbi:Uncharacterised protein [Yersinia mollaretii]|uniref:Uncharacterized protein n=1 Tax=Yersinia mollaretii TaxID=33060 RepID=A0AA36PND4_YERMO|nr:Uncharacterised protein [Yersinia mollaretii]
MSKRIDFDSLVAAVIQQEGLSAFAALHYHPYQFSTNALLSLYYCGQNCCCSMNPLRR